MFENLQSRIDRSQFDYLVETIQSTNELTADQCQKLSNFCQKKMKEEKDSLAYPMLKQLMSVFAKKKIAILAENEAKKKLEKATAHNLSAVEPNLTSAKNAPIQTITSDQFDSEIVDIESDGTKVYNKKSKFKSILFLICLGLVLGMLLPQIVLIIICFAFGVCLFI